MIHFPEVDFPEGRLDYGGRQRDFPEVDFREVGAVQIQLHAGEVLEGCKKEQEIEIDLPSIIAPQVRTMPASRPCRDFAPLRGAQLEKVAK